MRRYVYIMCLLIMTFINLVRSEAQSTFGENTILYVGERLLQDDTRTVYIMNTESEAEPVAIGYVNANSSDTGWSPDGRYVHIIYYDEEGNRILNVYDTQTETSEVVTDSLYDAPCILPAYWSPDDHSMVYTYVVNDQIFIALKDFSVGTDTVLSQGEMFGSFYYAVWSPEGRYVIVPAMKDNSALIWDTSTDSEVTRLTINTVQRLVWSADERYLMFVQRDEDKTVVIIYDTVTDEMVETSGQDVDTFSPDSRYAMYTSKEVEDAHHTVYLYNLTTHTETIFTTEASSNYRLWWTSDSKHIAYMTVMEDDAPENYNGYAHSFHLYDTATGESKTPLPEFAYVRSVVWSASQDAVAINFVPYYEDDTTPGRVITYNLASQSVAELDYEIPNPYFYWDEMQWSADGNYLYLLVMEEAASIIFDIETGEGIHLQDWIDVIGASVLPVWSADNRYLIFSASKDDTGSGLYVYDTAEHEATLVLNGEEYSAFIGWRGTDENASLIICGEG